MNKFLSDIFMKIADKLGFKLQEKEYFTNDFYDVKDISMTAILADRLSTLITADSDIELVGRMADVIQEELQDFFDTRLKAATTTAIGTGDVLIVPVTNGEHYDCDIIENSNFTVIDSIGNKLYAVVMKRDEFVKNYKTYRRFEFHGMETVDGQRQCRIVRYGYIDDVEVPLSSVKEWESIPVETVVPNVDGLLLGRIKCPTLNRKNINSAQGVPITYGLDDAVRRAKESYKMTGDEYRAKKTRIFADKKLFKKDENDDIVLPDGGVYQIIKPAGLDGGALPIKEYAPAIQGDQLQLGQEMQMKSLELFCGLDAGILTNVETGLATATAIRASMNHTFAFVSIMRKAIEAAITDLVYAVTMLYNANTTGQALSNITPVFDWDESMMENSTERFNMLLQGTSVDVVSKAELRAWLMNETKEQAQDAIDEMDAQSGSGLVNADMMDMQTSGISTQDAKQQVQDTAGKSLNGAQTQSLLAVMEQYASGALTLNQAINILSVSIGVTKDEASSIIQGL